MRQLFQFQVLPKRNENVCTQKDLYGDVHSSFINSTLKLEITQMFINRMNRSGHSYNQILLISKEEKLLTLTTWVNLKTITLKGKPRCNRGHAIKFHSYDVLEMAKIIYDERNQRSGFLYGWRDRDWPGRKWWDLSSVIKMFDILIYLYPYMD